MLQNQIEESTNDTMATAELIPTVTETVIEEPATLPAIIGEAVIEAVGTLVATEEENDDSQFTTTENVFSGEIPTNENTEVPSTECDLSENDDTPKVIGCWDDITDIPQKSEEIVSDVVIDHGDDQKSIAPFIEKINEAKEDVRKDFTSLNVDAEKPTILERVLQTMKSQLEVCPELKYVIEHFQNQEKTLLGELAVYRKDHPILFAHFLHEILLPINHPSGLALRSRIDVSEMDLCGEDYIVHIFEQEVMPFLMANASFYNIEEARKQAKELVKIAAAAEDVEALNKHIQEAVTEKIQATEPYAGVEEYNTPEAMAFAQTEKENN